MVLLFSAVGFCLWASINYLINKSKMLKSTLTTTEVENDVDPGKILPDGWKFYKNSNNELKLRKEDTNEDVLFGVVPGKVLPDGWSFTPVGDSLRLARDDVYTSDNKIRGIVFTNWKYNNRTFSQIQLGSAVGNYLKLKSGGDEEVNTLIETNRGLQIMSIYDNINILSNVNNP